jgi:NAD(P)-dependent dehydrogenase (short-subunit alcohol dehydrogenase family)
MRIVIFGANGQTGRLLTGQALAAGHDVTAVTRRPAEFPVTHDRLAVVEADVHDAPAADRAVEGADVVLSALGVPFARKQITTYSQGAANIVAAMSRHGVKRLIVVSSSATEPHHHADGGFALNRVFQPLVTATIGKTTYADMRRMEDLVRGSDLESPRVRDQRDLARHWVKAYGESMPGMSRLRSRNFRSSIGVHVHHGQGLWRRPFTPSTPNLRIQANSTAPLSCLRWQWRAAARPG